MATIGATARLGCMALALCLLAGTALAADPEPAPRELSVARTLLKSLTADRAADPELVTRRLIERGKAVVPALVVAGRDLRESEHFETIVAVLRRLDRSALPTYLLEYVAKQEESRVTNAAWIQLAEAGDATSIPPLLAAMNANPYYLKPQAESALTRLLVRNDRFETFSILEQELETLSEETRMRITMCVGRTDSEHGLQLLAKLLGRWKTVDHALVAAIAQMPEAGRGEEIAARLRPYLDNPDREIRRETITALAMFADVESAKTLIESLGGEDRGIRGNSHWALKKLSGLEFPESPERWKLWHTDEMAWWEAEGADLLEVLETGTELQILEALRTISVHRLYRMKFSPLLRRLLEHPRPDVRAAAEDTLVRLGLLEGSKAPDASTALAAHGFESITPEEYRKARTVPAGPASAVDSGPSRILPIAAIIVLLLLLCRLFGRSLLQGVGRLWGGNERQKGPIVLTVQKEKGEKARV